MSDHQNAPSDPTTKISDYLGIVQNSDGTIRRLFQIPRTPAAPDPNSPYPVLSKDIPLNPKHNTWVRIFLPREALDNPSTKKKLPLIVYFHGGGFVICSADSSMFHDFCSQMAVQLGVMIVSVEYRLAPEHRLPAAYDDAMDALQWIEGSHDEWLRDFVDFSQCFLMGSSAGGNIAYHVGLRAAAAHEHGPLKIGGLILHHPYFGGSKRSGSELRLINDRVWPLSVNDSAWELALPIGVDRDHEYCNPTVHGGESTPCERLRIIGCRVMVTGCDGDPLVDRQIELGKMLDNKGVQVLCQFGQGGYHGVELLEPEKAKSLFETMKDFIYASIAA